MRIGFGHLGHTHILWDRFMQFVDMEVAVPPPSSRLSLDIGVRHCAEALCAPCKILFGNYVQALEQGADCLVMLGGEQTCRLGYSVHEQALLLRSLGYEFRVEILNLQRFSLSLLNLIRRLVDRPALVILEAVRFLIGLTLLVDEVEQLALRIRPREAQRGQTNQALRRALGEIAALSDRRELHLHRERILELVRGVPHDAGKACPRVALVGDPYTILEGFFNLDMVATLGHLGLEVNRWFWLSEGLQFNLVPRLLRRNPGSVRWRLGGDYLPVDVGGFARLSVGAAALFSREGYDGLIHVAPFSCTPESVGEIVLRRARQEGFPLLSLEFDEHTGRAGLLTRLEAFADMLLRRWGKRHG